MKTRLTQIAAFWLAILSLSMAPSAMADELTQTFASWPAGTASYNGWSVSNGAEVVTSVTNLTTNSLRFTTTSTNGILRFPVVTNGVGILQFYKKVGNTSYRTNISFQKSADAIFWTELTKVTISGFAYSVTNITINEYGTNYFRFCLSNTPSFFTFLDDIRLFHAPAKLQIDSTSSKTTLGDTNVYVNQAVNITAAYTPFSIVSNLAMTTYYRVGDTGNWQSVSMTNNANNSYTTTNPIAGQSVAGKVYYYITATFTGAPPSAPLSPTNYPVAGSNTPTASLPFYKVTALPFLANNSSMLAVTNGVSSAMTLAGNYFWETFIPYSGTNFLLQFQGVSNTWGDTAQSTSSPPFTLQADLSSPTLIQINPSTNLGQFVIRFTETNNEYTIKQAAAQTFNSWSVTNTGNDTNNQWVLFQGFTSTNADLQLRDRVAERVLVLESNKTSWIQSPRLPDGIGEIAFWYRNYNVSGTPATSLLVEKSTTGGTNDTEWTRLAAVTNFTTTDYTRFTLVPADRNSYYIRVRTATNYPNARICLDELMVAQPGAGVAFAAVAATPASPAFTNTVSISATITPAGNASNLLAKVWYRSGSTGGWDWITMTNNAGTFTSISPIPAAKGDRPGGAGTVQYYIECAFGGYESAYSSPFYYPAVGSNVSYVVQSSWLMATNSATEPVTPLLNSTTKLLVDFIPQAGASNVVASAYYRLGGSGGYTSNSMSLLSNFTYRMDGVIPTQSVAGLPLDYYFSATFSGADPVTPTNYPATATNAVFSTIFHSSAWTSSYSTVSVVTGNVARAMLLAGDSWWRSVATYTNAVNPRFRFAGTGVTSRAWGDAAPSGTRLPVYGAAQISGADILVTGTVSGTVLYQFNDTNLQYSAQKATAADLYSWPASTGVSTNVEGWVLSGRAGQTNGAYDRYRVFNGPFMALDGGSRSNYLRSPDMTNGIGEVSFFYRNWDTNGLNPVKFTVEASANATGVWTEIQAVTNIISADYRLFYTVFSDPRLYHYVRIRNNSTAQDDTLCLDETVISEGGADIAFSNLTTTPTAPTVMDDVTISVTLTPLADATNLIPFLWYKIGNSAGAYWESVALSNVSNNLYQAMIPRGPITSVYYYVQCSYSGFFAQTTSPTEFPYGGSASPAVYTNADGGLFEGFESWSRNTSALADYATNDWDVYNAQCRGDGTTYWAAPGSTNNAIWLSRGTSGNPSQESQIITPLVTNLYGIVYLSFLARNSFDSAYDSVVDIYTTYSNAPSTNYQDISTWTSSTNFTVPSKAVWTSFSVELTNNLFRIMLRKKGSASSYLGVDRVEIAQRSSMITFSNLVISPGYPGTNDAVTVSCSIDSYTPGMPAYNFQPFLYYRQGQGTNMGPLAMARVTGSHQFITTTPIPGSVAVWDTNISFYIKCNFDGYVHPSATNYSPMYSPADYNNSTNSYTARLKSSDYGTMDIFANSNTTVLDLLDAYTWQGVLQLDSTASAMRFDFDGYSFFTGSGFSPFPTNWGQPDNQWKTNLPLADIAIAGRTNQILAAGPLGKGQYVARLNERTGEFTFQSCVAQNFETWGTSTNYQYSLDSGLGGFTNDFNNWPLNSTRSQADTFDSPAYWTNNGLPSTHGVPYYTNSWYNGPAGWGIYQAMMPTTIGVGLGATYGVLLKPYDGKTSKIINGNQGLDPLEGISTISFSYKAFHTNVYNGTNWVPVTPNPITLNVYSFATNDYENEALYGSPIATITNIITNSFSTFSLTVNDKGYHGIAITHGGGSSTVVVDSVSFSDFAAYTFETNDWKASKIWMQANSGRSGAAIEFDGRRFVTNSAYLQTPGMTNGIGFLNFYYKSFTNTQPVSFDVKLFKFTSGGGLLESTIESVTNSTSSWLQYSTTLLIPPDGYTNMYLKIVPTSTNRLFIDDVRVMGNAPGNSWAANNAKITDEDGRRFRKTAIFLNNGLSEINTNAGMCYTQEWPYVKSPEQTNGIGEVSFWYRNWENTASPTPALLRLQKSDNTGTNWTTFASISNIQNKGFVYYRTNLYDNDSHYVRIINVTGQTARIILDEILVTPPMAADLKLSNLRISPEVPLYSNTVHVFVDLSQPFLYPSNITLETEYSVAASYGAWTETNTKSMYIYSNNVAAGTWTYRTIDPIPTNAADQFVLYQARATFAGLNAAGHTSPKYNRSYSEPAFYYPVNTNGSTNPYYIVLSVATNAVWINEVDPGYDDCSTEPGPNYYDFVEVAGQQYVNIGRWKIVFFTGSSTNPVFSYTIPTNTLLPSTTNGFGFYLLGKATLPVTPNLVLTNDIRYPGGVALQRPSGMYSSAICFGDGSNDVTTLRNIGFYYIGRDYANWYTDEGPNSISMVGTGSYSTAFSWKSKEAYDPALTPATPGIKNTQQTLVGSGISENLPPSEVHIVGFWFEDQKVWMTVTGTNAWLPSPWYTTNLMVTNSWTLVSPFIVSGLTNWIYTLHFSTPTSYPTYFFKVKTTNAPN